jgi:hypothetical protein
MTHSDQPVKPKIKMDLDKAFTIIVDNMKMVIQVAGHDLVVVLGMSQVGKSTIINILRGFGCKWEEGPHIPKLVITTQPPGLVLATMGESTLATTEIPCLYHGFPGYLLLDTCGVGQIGDDHTNLVVSSILIEMICKAAKSVRIVCVATFNQLKTLSTFKETMMQIGGLLSDTEAPILWIFNQHPVSDPECGDFPLSKADITKATKAIARQIEHIFSTIAPRPGRNISQEEIRAIDSLKLALDAHPSRVAYIDPVTPATIDTLRLQINNLPPIPLSAMKFETANQYRSYFDDELEARLRAQVLFLESHTSFRTLAIARVLPLLLLYRYLYF